MNNKNGLVQLTNTSVVNAFANTSLEEAGTPVTAEHAIVFAIAFVSTHFTGYWNRKSAT